MEFNLTEYSQNHLSQLSQPHEDHVDKKIIFIVPKDKTLRDLSEPMSHAFQLAIEHQLKHECLREEEILPSTPKKQNIFVIEKFEGLAFETLEKYLNKTKGIKILGPQCLCYVMQRAELNCNIRNNWVPTLTLGMRNAVITLTGFDKEERPRLHHLIQQMNGLILREFTQQTTHLVANNIYTAKVLAAFQADVPVMKKEWVLDVYEKSQMKLVSGTDPEFLDFICPIFYKLNTTVSQVSTQMKQTLKNLIERNGGICSFQLKRGEAQILIVPKPEGEKFKFAQEWKIPCVRPDWIEKCVDAKRLLPYNEFRVINKARLLSSTRVMSDVEIEIDTGSSLLSNITKTSDNMTRTLNTPDINPLLLVGLILATPNSTAQSEADLEILRSAASSGYLDGLCIYLSGSKSEEMKKLINNSGAMRLDKICSKVSHIVVTTETISPLEIPMIKCLQKKPKIVRFEWVLASAKNGFPADEEIYEINLNLDSSSEIPKKSVQPIPFQSFPMDEEPPGSQSILIENGHDLEELVEQIPHLSRETLRKGSNARVTAGSVNRDIHNLEIPMEMNSFGNCNVPERQSPAEEMETESEIVNSETSHVFVFFQLKFNLLDELKDHKEFLECGVRKLGGEICTKNPDIVIGPPLRNEKVPVGINCFTEDWLNECHSMDSRNIEIKFHHISLQMHKELKNILKGVVAAVSAYLTNEKEYIAQLVTGMGGTYQEVFARKSSLEKGNVQKSTILICSTTDNDKYKAAIRWQVPVVTVEWALACYNEKSKVNESRFLTSNKQGTPDSTINFFPITPSVSRVNSKPVVTNSKMDNLVEKHMELQANGFRTPPVPGNRLSVLSNRTKSPATPETPLSQSQGLTQTPEPMSAPRNPEGRKFTDLKSDDTFDSPYYNPCGVKWKSEPSEDSIIMEELNKLHSMAAKRMANEERITEIPRWILRNNASDDETASPATKKLRHMLTSEKYAHIPYPDITPDISLNESVGALKVSDSESKSREKENEPRVQTPHESQVSPAPGPSRGVRIRPQTNSPRKSTENQHSSNEWKTTDETMEDLQVDQQFKEGDVVIYLSITCEEIMEDLENVIKSLGGFTTTNIKEPHLTHLIYQGKVTTASKYAKQVHDKNKVSFCPPQWVWDCGDKNEFVPYTKATSNSKPTERTTRSRSKDQRSEKPKLSIAKSTIHDVMNDEISEREIPSTQDFIGNPLIWNPNDEMFKSKNTVERVETHKSPPKESQPLTFALNNTNPNKKEIVEVIKSLGGFVHESQQFDYRVDGLITNALSRNEKALCSIASGAFIVKEAFVYDSLKKKQFLPVEEYFFRPEELNKFHEKSLARAAIYWYKKIKRDEKSKPYSGMEIYLIEKEERKKAISRLITAGGGKTVETPDEATMILSVDEKEGSKLFKKLNVPYFPVNYLNEIITDFQDDDAN